MPRTIVRTTKIIDLQASGQEDGRSRFRLSRKDWNKVKFPEDEIVATIFGNSGIPITIGKRRDFLLMIYMEQGIKTEKREEALSRLEEYMIKSKLL